LGGVAEGTAAVPLRLFASELGVLFQIVDDILDVTGTDDALGKPRGSDERHGKQTYVSEFGIDRARELAAESHATAVRALSEAAERTPATAEAVGAGARRDPHGERATDELERIADFIYTRTS
jgi:geranylgeranyl diphosphate synthase type II